MYSKYLYRPKISWLILILNFVKIHVVFSKLNVSIEAGTPPPACALINTQAH